MIGNQRAATFVIIALGVLLLCGSLAPQPHTCVAPILWETDFNNTGFAFWHIETGSFSTSTNALVATTVPAFIWRNAETLYGTWSFDIFWNGSLASIHLNMNGFMVRFSCPSGGTPSFSFHHYSGGVYQMLVNLEGKEISRYYESWVAVDVTRDQSNDEFMVYFNGTNLWAPGEVIQPIYSSVAEFAIEVYDTSFAFDNVAVSNTIDITPPPPRMIPGFPTATLLLGIATAIGLGIITRRGRVPPRAR